MFQVNEYVMHGGNGVCQITEIGSIDLSGVSKDKLYYTLKPIFGRGNMIYTPIDSDKVVIRKLISKEKAEEMMKDISGVAVVNVSSERIRENIYKEIIKSYDCKQWLSLIKTLYQRKDEREISGKKMTSLDERYLKIAEEYLFGELSIVLEIDKECIEEKILDKLKVNMEV